MGCGTLQEHRPWAPLGHPSLHGHPVAPAQPHTHGHGAHGLPGPCRGDVAGGFTFTWKTSSLPPTLNCDSKRMVNFSSVTDSAPRRSERLIRFRDCRDTRGEHGAT